jgi:outer membrane protein, multidrug efflux system
MTSRGGEARMTEPEETTEPQFRRAHLDAKSEPCPGGTSEPESRVQKGRLNRLRSHQRKWTFSAVPSGLIVFIAQNPMLKHWAILISSLRDGEAQVLVALGTCCVLGLLAGCAVGPDYHPPKTDVPPAFHAAPAQAGTSAAAEHGLEVWWRNFNDPQLNRLIEEAVATNLDVRLAEARVREARAQLQVSRAGLFPVVDANASYTRSHSSQNAFVTGVPGTTGTTGTGTTSTFGVPLTSSLYQAGFDASWELDVFGGTRRQIESSRDTLEAQIEARRNALVTLLGEVAQNYAALRGYQLQLVIVRTNLSAQLDTLNLQRSKLQAGIATDLDVANAEAQSSSTESQLPILQTQIQQAIHQLSVLLDREPGALESQLEVAGPVPQGPATVPPGLPSELLRRRPDVRQAERQLAAATANIGVATADLFPKFNLTGSAGLESVSLSSFANNSSGFWSFGPSITWRIFSGGQIRANIRVQDARQEEAFIQYRQVVLQSLQDVENALVAYHNEQVRRRSLGQAVDSAHRAVSLALQLNNAGVVDFLNVLNAQQALYQAQVQLAQSDQAVATDLVALYKALGGGWESLEQRAASR